MAGGAAGDVEIGIREYSPDALERNPVDGIRSARRHAALSVHTTRPHAARSRRSWVGHRLRCRPQDPEKQKAVEVAIPFRVPLIGVAETNAWLFFASVRGTFHFISHAEVQRHRRCYAPVVLKVCGPVFVTVIAWDLDRCNCCNRRRPAET